MRSPITSNIERQGLLFRKGKRFAFQMSFQEEIVGTSKPHFIVADSGFATIDWVFFSVCCLVNRIQQCTSDEFGGQKLKTMQKMAFLCVNFRVVKKCPDWFDQLETCSRTFFDCEDSETKTVGPNETRSFSDSSAFFLKSQAFLLGKLKTWAVQKQFDLMNHCRR